MSDLEVGAVIADRYEVRGVLGRGGTGTVYLAIDRIRGDEVALKILHEELASDPAVVARMMREAELLARVGHVLECGQTRIGLSSTLDQVYIVMPKLEGEPLSALLDAGTVVVEPARASQALGEGPNTQMSVRMDRGGVDALRPIDRPRTASERPLLSAPRQPVLPWWGWVAAGCVGSALGAWLAWR
jgi:hypothetical protein